MCILYLYIYCGKSCIILYYLICFKVKDWKICFIKCFFLFLKLRGFGKDSLKSKYILLILVIL